jgi:hypothetical protein
MVLDSVERVAILFLFGSFLQALIGSMAESKGNSK